MLVWTVTCRSKETKKQEKKENEEWNPTKDWNEKQEKYRLNTYQQQKSVTQMEKLTMGQKQKIILHPTQLENYTNILFSYGQYNIISIEVRDVSLRNVQLLAQLASKSAEEICRDVFGVNSWGTRSWPAPPTETEKEVWAAWAKNGKENTAQDMATTRNGAW